MDNRIYMLVHKELTGEMTQSETEELRTLRAEEGGLDLTQDVSLIWNVSKEYFPRQDWNTGSAKAQFLNKIRADKAANVEPIAPIIKPVLSNTTSLWKIGAGIILLVALTYLAFNYINTNTASETEAPLEIIATDVIEYATLDDNTQIWLSPGSTISNVSISSDSRSLSLDGEAFFDITHDPSRAFKINLGEGVNIEVLGTSFKASSSDNTGKGVVSVRDGRVRLFSSTGEKNNTILTAGETGELNALNNHVEKFSTSEVLSLGNIEDLSLKNLSLDKVFDKLSDYYGVKISNVGATIDCKFNSPLTGDPSIAQVVEIISAVYPNLSIELKNRSTYAVSGSCK